MRLLLITAALLLAGCSTPPAAVTTAPPTTTTTTTTPPPLSKPDAARRYLEIVKPYNVALEALEQSINSGQPIGTLRGGATALGKVAEEEIRQLEATRWPAEVSAPMAELIAESRKQLPFWQQAAQAQNRDQVIKAVRDSMKHNGKAPAKQIREVLELAKYDERDYGGS